VAAHHNALDDSRLNGRSKMKSRGVEFDEKKLESQRLGNLTVSSEWR
jgi:hypothetical protein